MSNETLLKNFSTKEFGQVVANYKHLFKDQLKTPTADNNHIINYNLKVSNFVMMNETIHMLVAGGGVFGIRSLIGNFITK